jgi:sec-independent protein translocase protein TatA
MRLGPAEITILALVAILLLGWKKLPDMARSLGRSMRVFKSEVSEMKNDGKSAQGAPVQGEVVPPPAPPAAPPMVQQAPPAPPVASPATPMPQAQPASPQAPEQPWRPDATA